MNYFKDEKNVREYIKMVEGYDGQYLIKILKRFLSLGASLLELLGWSSGRIRDCGIQEMNQSPNMDILRSGFDSLSRHHLF